MTEKCPMCAAGNKPLKTMTVDFSRLKIADLPRVAEAARKADRVIFLNLELSDRDAKRFFKAMKS